MFLRYFVFGAHAAFGALRGVPARRGRGCLKSRLLSRQPVEFKIKSLYYNDLILNVAHKIKEAVQKLKFLDSPEGETSPFEKIESE